MRALTAAGVAAFVVALALDNAGYFPHSWIWAAVVPAWLAVLAVLLRTELRIGRRELWWLGGLVALTAWTALSHTWSDVPAQTLLEARRDLVYVSVALAVVVGLDRRRAREVPGAVLAAITALLAVALLRYLLPGGRHIDPFEGALLSWPIGYANGVGALGAIAVPLGLGGAVHARTAPARAAAAASLAAAVAAIVLSSSRGGAIAAVAGIAALVWLDPRRRSTVRASLRAAPAVAIVLAGSIASRLTSDTLSPSTVTRGKIVAGIAILVGAALLAALGRGAADSRRTSVPTPRALGAVLGAAVVVGALVTALPRLHAESELRRLVGSARAGYWQAAWHEALHRPLAGTGADTFGRHWLLAGAPEGSALDAHNVYLESFAELGLVGLALLLAVVVVPLTATTRAVRASRVGAPAVAAYVAFLVHALVDWDWELPAVTSVGLVLGGSLLVLARRRQRTLVAGRVARGVLLVVAVALAVLALAGVGSHAVPSATAIGAAAARGSASAGVGSID